MLDEKLLTLSWQVQVALGGGYAAYMLAYVGIRDHHKGVDVAFRAVVFGLVASAVLHLARSLPPLAGAALAVTAALAAGVAWRHLGIERLRAALRKGDISWADDAPTAWATVALGNSRHQPTQLSVALDDGTTLICAELGRFNDDPFGPCVLGTAGDVALYVTDERNADGTVEGQEHVRDPAFGVRLTYVPSARIKRVTLRFLPDPPSQPLPS